ncbi:MAG TPA: HAMP domain-containing sensor histidine kinase [Chitinophagaceae bacterium]|nr:HAMP domain-containing sensor histidine kinase [Chitinophagaceae bacterium]
MGVRLKVTLSFAIISFAILSLVCSSIYYFSYQNRRKNFSTRLVNRAVTTAHLLMQSETFNSGLLKKIDAATAATMVNKTIQAFDLDNNRVYYYSDNPDDTIPVTQAIVEEAKANQYAYFSDGNRDAVAYHHSDKENHLIIITAAYDEEGKQNLQQLRFVLIICFLGGIFITVAGGYFFSAGLLKPIKKIADEVNEISAQNLARRIEAGKSKDEWYYLNQTINDLLDRLEESFKTQARFIANASHELSTPLTSVSSQLEVTLQKERTPDEYRNAMQSVLLDIRHLNKLTQTLLAFAKASGTAGGIEISLVRVDEVLMRMPREMAKANALYQVRLNFDNLPEEDEKMLVLGNEDLLFSAVRNIVINACKYSPDNTAFIKLSVKKNTISIAVTDKGKGMTPEVLQHIFQPFYRSDDSDAEAGFGLGLSLTRRIIKLQRGQIEVTSVINKGTTFTILLPVAGTK